MPRRLITNLKSSRATTVSWHSSKRSRSDRPRNRSGRTKITKMRAFLMASRSGMIRWQTNWKRPRQSSKPTNPRFWPIKSGRRRRCTIWRTWSTTWWTTSSGRSEKNTQISTTIGCPHMRSLWIMPHNSSNLLESIRWFAKTKRCNCTFSRPTSLSSSRRCHESSKCSTRWATIDLF